MLAQALGLNFKRIQFTPDLMPSDILGSEILDENRQFKFIKGPVFSNIILADEINRTPPKTQAALLEAMQERSVTIAGENYKLDLPYFVLATQNPIEQEGILCLRPSWIVLCLLSSSNTLFCRRSSGSETHDFR
jgi:MoxR-like ATPase